MLGATLLQCDCAIRSCVDGSNTRVGMLQQTEGTLLAESGKLSVNVDRIPAVRPILFSLLWQTIGDKGTVPRLQKADLDQIRWSVEHF